MQSAQTCPVRTKDVAHTHTETTTRRQPHTQTTTHKSDMDGSCVVFDPFSLRMSVRRGWPCWILWFATLQLLGLFGNHGRHCLQYGLSSFRVFIVLGPVCVSWVFRTLVGRWMDGCFSDCISLNIIFNISASSVWIRKFGMKKGRQSMAFPSVVIIKACS